MDGGQGKGFAGVLGLLACIALYAAVRRFFPGFSRLLLVIGIAAVVLIGLLVALVLFLALRRRKKTLAQQYEEERTAILKTGRGHLMEVRQLAMRIKNQEICRLSERICAAADKILRALKEHPEDISRVQKFFSYYLPTLGNILRKYSELEKSGVPAASAAESTIACLQNIETAMEKQYASLFEDDILDLTVEMQVLRQMCRQDGLLAEEDFPLEQQDDT